MKIIRILAIVIILVAGALIAYFALTPKLAPEFVSVDKISVGNVTMLPTPSFDLAAELEFNNPNSFGLNIEEVSCEVFIEDQNVTKITHNHCLENLKMSLAPNNKKIEVLPNAHFSVPLDNKIKLNEQVFKKIFGANLFQSLLSNELKMKFVGEMTISKFGISRNVPFSYDYKYNILQ